MNNFIIPANSKKSQMILGFFTPSDLILFLSGLGISGFLLAVVHTEDIRVLFLLACPLLFSALLVAPVPHYHNVMTLLNNIMKYYSGQREYKWKGWCIRDYGINRKGR